MTEAEIETEVMLALVSGALTSSNSFRYRGVAIGCTILNTRRERNERMHAMLEVRNGAKILASTTCAVWTIVELRTIALTWGIRLVSILEEIDAKAVQRAAQGVKR